MNCSFIRHCVVLVLYITYVLSVKRCQVLLYKEADRTSLHSPLAILTLTLIHTRQPGVTYPRSSGGRVFDL